jgi:hypothetical protein
MLCWIAVSEEFGKKALGALDSAPLADLAEEVSGEAPADFQMHWLYNSLSEAAFQKTFFDSSCFFLKPRSFVIRNRINQGS